MNIKTYAGLFFFIFSTLGECGDLILTGSWVCTQKSELSSDILGINSFHIDYSSIETFAVQKGMMTITDNSKGSSSKLNYKMEFTYNIKDNKFVNDVESVDFSIEQDDLAVFPSDPSSLLSKVGEKITGTVQVISDNEMRSLYSDGAIIDCLRRK